MTRDFAPMPDKWERLPLLRKLVSPVGGDEEVQATSTLTPTEIRHRMNHLVKSTPVDRLRTGLLVAATADLYAVTSLFVPIFDHPLGPMLYVRVTADSNRGSTIFLHWRMLKAYTLLWVGALLGIVMFGVSSRLPDQFADPSTTGNAFTREHFMELSLFFIVGSTVLAVLSLTGPRHRTQQKLLCTLGAVTLVT